MKDGRDYKPGNFLRPTGNSKIFKRFRLINILLFVLAFSIMELLMTPTFVNVINRFTIENMTRFSLSSAEVLSAHIAKELSLLSKTARSEAVIEWMRDEHNEEKKARAFKEMSNVVGELYSFNLYVGIESSLNEYSVGSQMTGEIRPFTSFDERNPDDVWFYDCLNSTADYAVSVDRDHVLERKRFWLDYKVTFDGKTLGVVCTGLEFSHVAGELFSHYPSSGLRGLVIDGGGAVQMDSALMENKEFLYGSYEASVESEIADRVFLESVNAHLAGIEGYFDYIPTPEAIKLSSGEYRYLTITPIKYTDWSVLLLAEAATPFNMSYFVPVTVVALLLLVAFAVASSAVNYRLIFRPLHKLNRSLELMADDPDRLIYGTDRDDELGLLSNTIQGLFTQANVDALTGIYNRRFMERNLERLMPFLSRSSGLLSMLMLDIDFFKRYNDTYGHEKGDLCLKAVAVAISGAVTRETDFIARYGGEEFIAVLPNTDESGAMAVAEKLRENLRSLAIPHGTSDCSDHVTLSIGVTTGRVQYGQRWEAYASRADEALYQSKDGGRDRITFLAFNGTQ